MTTSRRPRSGRGKPKKVLLVARNRGRSLLVELASHLLTSGHRVIIEEKAAARIRSKAIAGRRFEVFAKGSRLRPDLAISLGGDGSFIHTAAAMALLQVPVTGVNLGKVGFLADIAAEQMLESVDAILAGDYRDEKRMLMRIRLRRAGRVMIREAAINDLVVSRGEHGPLMSLDVAISGRHAYHIRADGVIVSTPSGSTAYGMSAGGPIIAPGSESIGIVPLNPHSLTQRPLVISADSPVVFRPAGAGRIDIDGRFAGTAQGGDRIEVARHEKMLIMRHPTGYDYYDAMKSKLFWSQ